MSDTVAVTTADSVPAVLQPTLTDAIAAAQGYALQAGSKADAAATVLTSINALLAAVSGYASAAAASASSALTVATDVANQTIAMLRQNAPQVLDTFAEISAAINNDPSFASTLTTALAGKAAKGANADITSLSGLTTALSVAQGGTGATAASGARANLGAAASGSNSDITALTGLLTALTVAQGGTGATAPTGARANLGAAAAGANSDITALSGLTTPLSVGQGGSGGATPSAARGSLGAAASGANSDITSLSALSTPLSAPQGGTGIASYAIGDIIYAASTTTLGRLAGVATGNVLLSGGVGTAAAWGKVNLDFTTGHITGRLGTANMVQAPPKTLRGNPTGGNADVSDNLLTNYLDTLAGTAVGSVAVRGSTVWSALAPTAAGQVLTYDGSQTSFALPGATTFPGRSTVRQTVQGGPQSSGVPSFLPSTSASLTLTAQNVSTGASALTISAAQGYNGTGQNDIVAQLTSNPSWTLTASATNYLFINAQGGGTSIQTLQPIYQFGGTISTASGQFTFDYQAMIGYLGNGTSAVATPLVCVGEAVTNATTVTSTVAYAYNGYYDTGYTATLPGAGSGISYTHNLGVAATRLELLFLNTTSNLGYTPGDVASNFATSPTANIVTPIPTWSQRNTGGFTTGSNISFYGIGKTSGATGTTTSASWSYKMIFRRGWGGA